MADVMLACTQRGWDLDKPRLAADLLERWPASSYDSDERLEDTLGQVVVRDGSETVLVELLTVPGGLGVDGDDALVARVLALIAETQAAPAGGSLLAIGWCREAVALTPGVSAEALMDLAP